MVCSCKKFRYDLELLLEDKVYNSEAGYIFVSLDEDSPYTKVYCNSKMLENLLASLKSETKDAQ